MASGNMRVCVASKNPVKIESARRAVSKALQHVTLDIVGLSVPSGVPDQPMTDVETRKGAENRARGAKAIEPDCDLYFGIEGGIEADKDGKLICFAWELRKEGAARTATFELPEEVSRLVRSGIELGAADDKIFGRENSKHHDGTVGKLTLGLVDRTSYYEHAAILALVPFINPELYQAP